MANMPDEVMTLPDLEFERALPYHNEGYKSDTDYCLLPPHYKTGLHLLPALSRCLLQPS